MVQQDDGWSICEGVCQAVVAIPRENIALNEIPFLPFKFGKGQACKTYRMACKLCLIQKRQALCPHTLAERSFRSVYCLTEIAFAIQIGYEILALVGRVIQKFHLGH